MTELQILDQASTFDCLADAIAVLPENDDRKVLSLLVNLAKKIEEDDDVLSVWAVYPARDSLVIIQDAGAAFGVLDSQNGYCVSYSDFQKALEDNSLDGLSWSEPSELASLASTLNTRECSHGAYIAITAAIASANAVAAR